VALGVSMCPLNAHHSFPVHFNGDRTVTISGTVTSFRYRNPHGIVMLQTAAEGGSAVEWTVETNSPNILRRRGWSDESIQPGDRVTIVGFPSRDGSNFMRVYRLEFDDGRELIGQRPAPGVEL
jgi:hypothetical protein